MSEFNSALIVGVGPGLSASLARALAKKRVEVALAARSTGDLDPLAAETGAKTFACDASRRADVDKLFADLDGTIGPPEMRARAAAGHSSSSTRSRWRRRSR